MNADPRFSDITYKIDETDGHAFKDVRPPTPGNRFLHLGGDDLDPNELTGEYLSPEAFREAILDENTVVIDARNDYEYDLGHSAELFVRILQTSANCRNGSVKTKNNLWKTSCDLLHRRHPLRKFSGWLVKEGFKDVGQLHGGIATYGKDETVKGDLWDGKCMSSMSASVWISIASNMSWSEGLVRWNTMRTLRELRQSKLQPENTCPKKTSTNTCAAVRMNVASISRIIMCNVIN